jgi:trimeric autotransporter adhesin
LNANNKIESINNLISAQNPNNLHQQNGINNNSNISNSNSINNNSSSCLIRNASKSYDNNIHSYAQYAASLSCAASSSSSSSPSSTNASKSIQQISQSVNLNCLSNGVNGNSLYDTQAAIKLKTPTKSFSSSNTANSTSPTLQQQQQQVQSSFVISSPSVNNKVNSSSLIALSVSGESTNAIYNNHHLDHINQAFDLLLGKSNSQLLDNNRQASSTLPSQHSKVNIISKQLNNGINFSSSQLTSATPSSVEPPIAAAVAAAPPATLLGPSTTSSSSSSSSSPTCTNDSQSSSSSTSSSSSNSTTSSISTASSNNSSSFSYTSSSSASPAASIVVAAAGTTSPLINELAQKENGFNLINSNSTSNESATTDKSENVVEMNTEKTPAALATPSPTTPVLSFQIEIDDSIKKRIDEKLKECADTDDSDSESDHNAYTPKAVDLPSAQRLAKRLYYLDGFKANDIVRHLSKK